MIAIYKITSPTNKVYIGQSINVEKRIKNYIRYGAKGSFLINRSFKKYGVENHVFSICHELPKDVSKDTLTLYEQIYTDQYRDCGFELLNICPIKEHSGRQKCVKEFLTH